MREDATIICVKADEAVVADEEAWIQSRGYETLLDEAFCEV